MTQNYQNADMLDIIFENRNHAYGAYALRRTYNKSLQQAMLITFSSLAVLLLGNFLREKFFSNSIASAGPTVIVSPTDVAGPAPKKEQHEIKPPKPPKPQVLPPTQATAVASTRSTEIKVIHKDPVQQDTIISTKELASLTPGVITNTTPAPTGGVVVVEDVGTGKGPTGAGRDEGPLVTAEIMPVFPGGEDALMKFLGRNTVYPDMERSNGIEGKTYIEFVVNEDGSISDATIMKSQSYGFSKEALRVVGLLPKFKPGMQQGHPVRVQYVLPFTFKIKD